MYKIFYGFVFIFSLGSCVPPGLLITAEQKADELNSDIQTLLKKQNDSLVQLKYLQKEYLSQISILEEELKKSKNSVNNKVDTAIIESLIISNLSNKFEINGIGKNILNNYHYDAKNSKKSNGFLFELKNQFKNYDNKLIYIKVDDAKAIIELSDKLFFAQSSSVLTKQSMKVLEKIAILLKSYPSLEVTIEGHSDNMKIKFPNKYGIVDNLDLSLRRSAYVARLLSDKYGISSKSIIVSGRGEHMPIMNNKLKEGRSQNRRIRILLNPKVSSLL